MNPIRKTFALKDAALNDNIITGAASVMGCVDQGGDVIYPGFFSEALPDFRQNGFVPVGHKWDELPVCMPTLAEERGNELYTEAKFHSTQAAQDARTVCMERQAAGLGTGLSIGFYCVPQGYKVFKSGSELLEHAKGLKMDMSLFDAEQIQNWKGSCRALLPKGCAKLFEYSIVPAPMNERATVGIVKAAGQNILTELLAERKSEYLGDVERDSVCDVVYNLNRKLLYFVYRQLYNVGEAQTGDELVDSIMPAFAEFTELSERMMRALLADVDMDELREDAEDYYYYYSADKADCNALTLSEKAEHLETDAMRFVHLATRRQETRQTANRGFSKAAIERMSSISAKLADAKQHLDAIIAKDAERDAEPVAPLDLKAEIQKASLEFEFLSLL